MLNETLYIIVIKQYIRETWGMFNYVLGLSFCSEVVEYNCRVLNITI